MAITSAICNSFKQEILEAEHNFTASTGNTFNLAKHYIKSNSTIGKTRKNEEQKEKEINRFALKLHSIMFINYDSFKPFYERVEKEKERTRSSSYRFL